MFEADQMGGGSRWPLVRLGAGSECEVILCSAKFLPLTVHWVGRSTPCCGDGCSLCSFLPARGLFYSAVLCMSRVSILELGSMSASHLEQHVKLLHGGMKAGLVLRLVRRTSKAPIFSECVNFRSGTREVSMLELAGRVCALYQLPGPNPDEDLTAYQERLRGLAFRRCQVEAERLKKSHPGRV